MDGYIGCGSNLGDREANLAAGLDGLTRRGLEPARVSPVWDTAPIGCAAPNRFLNLVVRVETDRDPLEVLDLLLEVEREVGRIRGGRNAPRVLDLDLLLLGELRVDRPELRLPHPRMWERRFVLAPLAEIAPELCNPATGRTVTEEERALRADQPDLIRLGTLDLARTSPV